MTAGCFEALADDLRAVLRLFAGRNAEPSAAILDSRPARRLEAASGPAMTAPSASVAPSLHMAVDTLGNLLARHVTMASADDRAEVGRLAKAVQDAVGKASPSLMWTKATQASAPPRPQAHGIELEVVKLPEAKKGSVLLPRRWAEAAKVPLAMRVEGC